MKKYTLSYAFGVASVLLLCNSCKPEKIAGVNFSNKPAPINAPAAITCIAQPELNSYVLYKENSDGTHYGDVMPYFNTSDNSFYIYYLKDIWNDATNKHHPWYGVKTTTFSSYTELSAGELLSSSTNGCAQDYSVGTGSIIKSGSNYYEFYSGHNPNYPSSCVTYAEGIMLAKSTSLNTAFTKQSSFATIYPPVGQGFDEHDNFRDPYVFYDATTSKYYMLLAARKNVSGTFKGVIIDYTSTDLNTWTYQGVIYDGGSINYFMMETPQIFKIGSTYYLMFSDINTKNVLYRKSTSVTGTWNYPVGYDRIEGNGIYAAKVAADNTGKQYIFGWTNSLVNGVDSGAWQWGGNMVAHQLVQATNGDLTVNIPPGTKTYLENLVYAISKNSQWGTVTNTIAGTQSYNLVSNADMDVANVLFDPVNLDSYKISAVVSYSSASKDFGFMIGACDGYNDFYSLRFVPAQNRFSFDKVKRSALTSITVPTNDVPITLTPNTNYNVDIVVENSMIVVYINNQVALSSRIYKARRTTWGVFVDHSNATFNNIAVKYH